MLGKPCPLLVVVWVFNYLDGKTISNFSNFFSFFWVLSYSQKDGGKLIICIFLPMCQYDVFIALVWLQDSRSIGAIAGLAVAIVFTWRLLRSPSEPQRRQPKRETTAPSNSGHANHSNHNLISSGISSQDSNAQNVIDELFQPVKVNLLFPLHFQ